VNVGSGAAVGVRPNATGSAVGAAQELSMSQETKIVKAVLTRCIDFPPQVFGDNTLSGCFLFQKAHLSEGGLLIFSQVVSG
jgi:hypothetical protein